MMRRLSLSVLDHGGTPNQFHAVDIEKALEKTGFIVKNENGEIDWTKTRAANVGLVHIFINLEGREPNGIVTAEDYEATQREIIAALHAYQDTETRRHPFSLAVTRADAEMLNLHGDLVGDVVYALCPEFDGAHGKQLPSVSFGIGGQHSTFILSGAGVPTRCRIRTTSARCGCRAYALLSVRIFRCL